MDEKYPCEKLHPYRVWSGVKTSGEGSTEVVILVIRVPAVDIRTVGIGIADVHEITVRIASFPYLRAVCGINGTECAVTHLAPFA